MAYKLSKIGTQANVQVKEYICDAVDDLANLPADTPFGSTAFCIGSSETYTRASNGEYIKKTDGGGGVTPTGTLPISITSNGTTTHDVTQYASAEIVTNVNTDPEKGFVFGDYDSDGYPTVGRFVGNWTAIPTYFLTANTLTEITKNMTVYINSNIKAIGDSAFRTTNINIVFERGLETIGLSCFENNNKISNLHIPDTIIEIKTRAFNTLAALKSVSYAGNVPNIANGVFKYSNAVEVYDFSYATAIPTLYDTASLGHANGCVLKIPSALSDTTLGTGNGWESATNWVDLTDVTFTVV